MPTRFSTAEVIASQLYRVNLSARVQVGTLARYLSSLETHLDASTLELAKRVFPDQNLQSIDIQSGDRLLIFRSEPQLSVLPPLLRTGDKLVRFSNANFTATSGGKHTLIVGKSGESQPDIDLRRFISTKVVDYISRNCLQLNLQPGGNWQIARTGNTRVLLDEFELGQTPVPLSGKHRVRFYRASDTGYNMPPLGEVEVTVETVQTNTQPVEIEQGHVPVKIRFGQEMNSQLLRASETLSIKQVVDAVTRYIKVSLPSEISIYQTRVIAPTTTLDSLILNPDIDMFLYAPLDQDVAQHHLVMRHVHEPQVEYRITAGLANETRVFGCRLHRDFPDQSLDIDLYELITQRGYDPERFQNSISLFGQIEFNVTEKLWQLKLDQHTRTIFLINNVRIKNGVYVPLVSGDIVSLGFDNDSIHFEIQLFN